MTELIKKLILWDLDGTLCLHNEQFHHDAPIAVAKAAIKLGVEISIDDAITFAKQHYPGQRAAVAAFSNKFNINADILFQTYYKHLNDAFLSTNYKLIEAFDNNKNYYEYGVLTNASFYWAKKSLKKMELYDFFNSNLIFGYDELGQRLKTNKNAFNEVLAICKSFGYAPENIIIIDDKLKILKTIDNTSIVRIHLTEKTGKILGIHTISSPNEVFSLKV